MNKNGEKLNPFLGGSLLTHFCTYIVLYTVKPSLCHFPQVNTSHKYVFSVSGVSQGELKTKNQITFPLAKLLLRFSSPRQLGLLTPLFTKTELPVLVNWGNVACLSDNSIIIFLKYAIPTASSTSPGLSDSTFVAPCVYLQVVCTKKQPLMVSDVKICCGKPYYYDTKETDGWNCTH